MPSDFFKLIKNTEERFEVQLPVYSSMFGDFVLGVLFERYRKKSEDADVSPLSDDSLPEQPRFQKFDERSRIHVREAVIEILREVVPENILAQEPLDGQTPLNRLFPKWKRSKQWYQFTDELRKRKDYVINLWLLPDSPICTKIGNFGCLTFLLLFPIFTICSLYIIGRGTALDLDADSL